MNTIKNINHKRSSTAIICLSPFHGGMEMDAARIAKLLSSSMSVCLIAKEHSPIALFYSHGLNQHGIAIKTVNFSSFLSLSIILGVRKIIKEHHIKNVIYLGASELRSLFFSFMGLDINLIIRHGTTKSRPKKDFFHRLIYSKVNFHIAICQHLATNIRYIIPFGKKTSLKIIYSSLRHPVNLSQKIENVPVKIIHVGRIIDSKGQKDAIEACEILYHKNIKFEISFLGDFESDSESVFREYINSKAYKNQINLVGFKTDLSHYYNNSHILLFPSKGEGLSNTFIEALSYGLICISYKNTSFPEIHDLGFKFYMAQNLDLNSLKNTLLEAVDYLKCNNFPITDNIKLAQSLLNPKKELSEYLALLK